MPLSHPNSVIAYLYQYMFLVSNVHTRGNSAAILAILDGILNKVQNHLSYFLLISKNSQRRFTTFFNTVSNIFLLGLYREAFKNFLYQVLYYKILFVDDLFTAFQF